MVMDSYEKRKEDFVHGLFRLTKYTGISFADMRGEVSLMDVGQKHDVRYLVSTDGLISCIWQKD